MTFDVAVDARMEDERAAASSPLQALFTDQLAEGPSDGDQAAAVALGEVPFRRQLVARDPLAGVKGGLQVQVDLVVQRDGAVSELESRHRSPAAS